MMMMLMVINGNGDDNDNGNNNNNLTVQTLTTIQKEFCHQGTTMFGRNVLRRYMNFRGGGRNIRECAGEYAPKKCRISQGKLQHAWM